MGGACSRRTCLSRDLPEPVLATVLCCRSWRTLGEAVGLGVTQRRNGNEGSSFDRRTKKNDLNESRDVPEGLLAGLHRHAGGLCSVVFRRAACLPDGGAQ